jgi:diguanylate cyclase (GGDEF)-like protein
MAKAARVSGVRGALIRLLVVGGESVARGIQGPLEASRDIEFEIQRAPALESALAMLEKDPFDVLLIDLPKDDEGALDTLARAQVAASRVPIIALAEQKGDGESLSALRLGAQDYVAKSQADTPTLVRSIRHALERHRLLTQLQEARQREHFMATHDALTGLTNRVAFNDQLDRALAYAERNRRRLAIFLLDLDDFRYINDNLGHSVGDMLLNHVAERLAAELGRSDLVSRIGGDEFIVMVQGLDYDQTASRVAEKLLESLSMPFVLNQCEYWVTASLGISTFPRDGEDRETLVRHADTAMYYAKAHGKNNVQFYSEALNLASRKRLTVERALRRAFERGEIELHYQPIVDLQSRRITGAEALLRWNDRDLGEVPPADFIPLAEETGLIRRMGSWVLRTACEQAKVWHDAGFDDCGISVNLSAQQLRGEALRESIVRTLWDTGLDPCRLVLEITEGTLMDAEASAALRALKKIGVSISLDDFGTGFSSLSYLKFIPIDNVKIAESFVSDIAIDPDDAAIVAAVLSIAEQLRLRVIAEGVETEEQRNFLAARGCHEIQGFLFSPAVRGEAFLELLRNQHENDQSS